MNRVSFISIFVVAICFTGCRVHHFMNLSRPTVCVPEDYQHLDEGGVVPLDCQWWQAFGDEDLNRLVTEGIAQNLDLKQSWFQVIQACQQYRIVGSARYPEILTAPGVSHFRGNGSQAGNIGTGGFGGGAFASAGDESTTLYLLSNSLTYEVDLWRRIDSLTRAAGLEYLATREDLEAATLTLTGTIVDLWFIIQEQRTLLDVIDHQIEVSRTQLELIELRFSVGQSSALDVYQQRLQLSSILTQRPPVESLLRTAQNQMSVLLGQPPNNCNYSKEGGLVELPPFPDVGHPVELLCYRPDLRAQHRRLVAADYDVAAAIADRYPQFQFFVDYDFQAKSLRDLFDEQISRIIASLVTPIFDGGRRRAEVKRRQAIVCELLNSYGQGFLNALLEVEDAIAEEKYQVDLIELLNEQSDIADRNLEESQWRYLNGLNDYLNVITAIQTQQDLERRIVGEKARLLAIRARLYRALGGPNLYL